MSSPGSWNAEQPRRPWREAFGVGLVLMGLLSGGVAARGADVETVLTERPTPRTLRLAAGLSGRLGRKCRAFELGGATWWVFDLDGDGELSPEADGLGRPEVPFVVPLPATLLTAEGEYRLGFDGSRRLMAWKVQHGVDDLFPHAEALTRYRMQAGLCPLSLDAGGCRAAARHLDYLLLNGGLTGGMTQEAHRERPGRPGYSREGARAGLEGLLGNGPSLSADALAWYSSTYHAARFLDPDLRAIGLSRRHGLSLLFPVGFTETPGPFADRIWVHPPDGAVDVPPGFAPGGEVPSPVPNRTLGRGNGFPLLVRLPPRELFSELELIELCDGKGESVPGYLSWPGKPANPALPDNARCAFFIPRTRLQEGEVYSARIRIGREKASWSFRTWEWRPGK